MQFTNVEVDVGDLPAAEDVHLQPVQPAYKKVLMIEWTVTTIVLLIIAAVVILTNSSLQKTFGWAVVTIATFIVCAFYFISIQKSFPFLAYAIRDKDVILQRGWIVRSVKICPFNRIQNCSVQSGPLERRHRLASLIIYTAGTAGADMRITGLLQEEADRLRHFILDKVHTQPNEAL